MEYEIKITGSGTLEDIAKALYEIADISELVYIESTMKGEAEGRTLFVEISEIE